jgi:hypothetical protein
MTDLIKRLHHHANGDCDMTPVCSTLLEAADRIEQLERERDEARHLQSCACNYDTPTDVCMGHHALFERLYAVERGKLEAKLAKAMAGLRKIADHKHFSRDQGWTQNAEARIASTALAELEGGE